MTQISLLDVGPSTDPCPDVLPPGRYRLSPILYDLDSIPVLWVGNLRYWMLCFVWPSRHLSDGWMSWLHLTPHEARALKDVHSAFPLSQHDFIREDGRFHSPRDSFWANAMCKQPEKCLEIINKAKLMEPPKVP